MAAPYWDLRRKVADRVQKCLIANSGGKLVDPSTWEGTESQVPVRVGFTADSLDTLPVIVVVCDKSSKTFSEVSAQDDNTRTVIGRVVIKTPTDTGVITSDETPPEDVHNHWVAVAYDILNQSDIISLLQAGAVTDCTVQAFDLTDETQDVQGNVFISTHEFEAVAMPQ